MKRPFLVTLLSLMVVLLAVWNVFQIFSVLQRYDLMRALNITTEANLLIIMGLTWAIGFGLAAWGLWRLRSWGRTWMLIAIVAFQAQQWIMRFTLMRTTDEIVRRPADLFASLLGIATVWGILFIPKIRRLFQA